MVIPPPRSPVPRRPAPFALAVLAVLALVGVGCSDDQTTDGAPATDTTTISLPDSLVPTTTAIGDTTTTEAAPTGVVVDSFAVRAPLSCTEPTYDATVEWEARRAVAATVIVDGTQVAGPVPVEGPFVVTLPCDGVGHAVALVVVGADDSRVIRTQAVLPGPRD
ncbi:hypothetical protein [Rhabdothermincola salaria]|uniref:hypothetical protein n=1 Tax=Rhabdothermincola salaria TaxID=2903142 RepID=UPI001E5BFFDD|nr:hypothetical protein [Rhabdothermincola salaria]MCD9622988.1 hypothetical protein [Rhabdothermincola salaria]